MARVLEDIELIEWTNISQLSVKTQLVNTRFRVLKKGEPRVVTQRLTGRKFELAKCIVGDQTATIEFSLWNDDIDIIDEGKTYSLLNGSISVYDECISLTRGRKGELVESLHPIKEVNDKIDMSRPFMGKPKRKKKKRSSTGRTFQGVAGRETKGYCSRKGF